MRLFVADTGLGMNPETEARLYEPFFSTKQATNEIGLGLSTLFGIVKEDAGYIDVQTSPGKGTTFNIYLTALIESVKGRERSVEFDDMENETKTVLLVDDEAMVLKLGSAILQRLGYKVVTAVDGDEALSVYEQNNQEICLTILDMSMPKMSGREVLRAIRDRDEQAPVIISSGFVPDNMQDEPEKYKPSAYLKKPYLIATMADTLNDVLEG